VADVAELRVVWWWWDVADGGSAAPVLERFGAAPAGSCIGAGQVAAVGSAGG
jgi:hypothetical protein